MGFFPLRPPKPPPKAQSSSRYDWQDLRQEAAVKPVHSQAELIAAIGEAANANYRSIVIASDITINQGISLNVSGLSLSCAGSAQVYSNPTFTGPMFTVAANDVQITRFRMGFNPDLPEQYATLTTFINIDSTAVSPARVVGFELSNSRITVAEDGYIIDQGQGTGSIGRSCTISNNVWNYGDCLLRLNMSESQITGNSSLYEWTIKADNVNCFQNCISFNAMNNGHILTNRGLGIDYTSVVGNARVGTISIGTGSVETGNT